jgi:hypothetical protein
MPVTFERSDYKKAKKQYELIQHCLDGETEVKRKRTLYLPAPNPHDTTAENMARYQSYLTRAVFYNVTGRTMRGLQGQVFMRAPLFEIPDILDHVKRDATGLGVSVVQLAKESVNYAVAFGRGGIFVDFPATGEGGVTRGDLQSGRVKPTINVYDGEQIINWRSGYVDGKLRLTLVVLREEIEVAKDSFEVTLEVQYRALILDADGYRQELYNKTGTQKQVVVPLMPDGSRWSEIPFTFVGSVNNDPYLDYPPLYDLASLNLAHYRNSADYEESSYMVGQPTPVLTGLSEHWVEKVLGGRIELGSRAAIVLPEGASAQLLQALPNTLPFEAMGHKERQMVALGAKLVEQRAVQRTATEADMELTTEQSTLASSAENVSAAMTQAFKWCAIFIGETPAVVDKINFALSTEFDLIKMSSEERKAVIQEWQFGALTFSEMRHALRRAGIATLDDAAARQEMQTDGSMIAADEDEDEEEIEESAAA